MSVTHTTTRKSAIDVRSLIATIPRVLQGRTIDHHRVAEYFWAAFARSFFTSLQRSYEARAKGYSDELGNVWLPLAASTIRRRMSPKFIARYPRSAALEILRVSDRLYNSLSPGAYSGGTYQTVSVDQIFNWTTGRITIGTKAPYSIYVNARRPLLPQPIELFVHRATVAGTEAMRDRLATIFRT